MPSVKEMFWLFKLFQTLKGLVCGPHLMSDVQFPEASLGYSCEFRGTEALDWVAACFSLCRANPSWNDGAV